MNNEVVVADETMPVALMADNLVQMADMAEKRVNAIKRIKQAALSVTNKNDWVDQNGKPYLQSSGSEKVARLFGISWTINEPQLTTEEDGHFSYTYKGQFTIGSTPPIDFIGSRGSKDAWYSKSHGKDVPPSEIDRNDVKKAAYTNLLGNGITRLLGIRNLTWEEVNGAGIRKEDAGHVDYAKKEMSEEGKDLRAEMDRMLNEITKGDKEKIGNMVYELTSFTAKDGSTVAGKTTLTGLSEKSIPVVYGKIKKAYEEWKNNGN